MIFLKEYVISLVDDYILSSDSYKDVNGKGFVQRYLEIFGAELDEYYYPLIEGLENEWNPLTVTNTGYLDYIAFLLGDIPNIATDTESYRRVLTYIVSIYKIKGTLKSIYAILYPLKVVVTDIVELDPGAVQYDTGLTYDDGHLYDNNCPQCSEFDLEVTSVLALTTELYNKILDTLPLVLPINFKLRTLTFNGGVIEVVHIEVTIDEDGNLIYNNDADPGLVLTLSPDGDLIINGPNANRYFIAENGDLMFIDN